MVDETTIDVVLQKGVAGDCVTVIDKLFTLHTTVYDNWSALGGVADEEKLLVAARQVALFCEQLVGKEVTARLLEERGYDAEWYGEES